MMLMGLRDGQIAPFIDIEPLLLRCSGSLIKEHISDSHKFKHALSCSLIQGPAMGPNIV